MAFLYSTGFRDAVCYAEPVFGSFSGMYINLYECETADIPTSADAALDTTNKHHLLLTYSLAGGIDGLTLEDVDYRGILTKPTYEEWSGEAVRSGTPRFFRCEHPGDTKLASTSAKRIQGTVGISSADMILASSSIVAGSMYILEYFTLSFL